MKEWKELAKKTITQLIDPLEPNPYGWPPTCALIMYEPERPVIEIPKTADETKSSNNL